MTEGRIRLRSNIAVDPEAWDLVPGDALHRYAPYRLQPPYRPTQRQRDENTYYIPCHCGRRIHQINLEGCSECSHGPSEAERQATIARHEQAKRRIEKLRSERDEKGVTTLEDLGVRTANEIELREMNCPTCGKPMTYYGGSAGFICCGWKILSRAGGWFENGLHVADDRLAGGRRRVDGQVRQVL